MICLILDYRKWLGRQMFKEVMSEIEFANVFGIFAISEFSEI